MRHAGIVMFGCALSAAWLSRLCFSRPRQKTVALLREQQGRGLRVPEEEQTKQTHQITQEDARAVALLAQAGKQGRWKRASQVWRSYMGSSVTVFTAAMQAAYRCGQYLQGAEIYDQLRELPPEQVDIDSISLQIGMKVFGKLRNESRVDAIYKEVQEKGWYSMLTAGARLDAAAEMGDVEGAARLLDDMMQRRITTNINHFNSALNACKNAEPPSSNAAVYLFNALRDRGMKPTVVTFTNLVRACRAAPLPRIQQIRSDLALSKLQPDKVLAEAYVAALFFGKIRQQTTLDGFRTLLLDMDDARQDELRSALREFDALGVLTGLCRTAKKALSRSEPP
ncbi:unnamed protein product [Symbiodinium natans]|uniref:Pentacotripeptide-repeat region of PRORP domain-containing protein n=1 Tax=Symbiodinium natans TaxID=878477 RepID=A0A812Q9H1_9DINO|nr:unnamed protein product [Symbiodinium natans]